MIGLDVVPVQLLPHVEVHDEPHPHGNPPEFISVISVSTVAVSSGNTSVLPVKISSYGPILDVYKSAIIYHSKLFIKLMHSDMIRLLFMIRKISLQSLCLSITYGLASATPWHVFEQEVLQFAPQSGQLFAFIVEEADQHPLLHV